MTIFKQIILGFLLEIPILFLGFTCRKPFKFIFFNSFIGLCALTILYLIRSLTGFILEINYYSVITSGILGVPGVILLLILNFIILM